MSYLYTKQNSSEKKRKNPVCTSHSARDKEMRLVLSSWHAVAEKRKKRV